MIKPTMDAHMGELTVQFTQEEHECCPADKYPDLKATIHDTGAGRYLVLNATEWAMDPTDIGTFISWILDLKARYLVEPQEPVNG